MSQQAGNPYNMPDPSDPKFGLFDPIERSNVEIRLHPLAFPQDVDEDEHRDLITARNAASAVFSDFEKFIAEVDKDQHLSIDGRIAKKQAWARQRLPAIQAKLEKLTDDDTAGVKAGLQRHIATYMGKNAAPPTDPNDLQVCSEIRAMIRSLPERDRMSRVMELARGGDRMVLQAVLNAPAYLSGVDDTILKDMQIELTRAALPGPMRAWQNRKDDLLMTRRALDGVVRYVGGQTKTLREIRTPRVPAA